MRKKNENNYTVSTTSSHGVVKNGTHEGELNEWIKILCRCRGGDRYARGDLL